MIIHLDVIIFLKGLNYIHVNRIPFSIYAHPWEEQIMIRQEGITEGRIEGEKIGRLRGKRELLEKLSDKFSIEQISEMLEIDISELKNIMKEIQNEKYL